MAVRLSLKTVLRDCVIMLCGTVLGILLAQGFMANNKANNKAKIITHLTKKGDIWPVASPIIYAGASFNPNQSQKTTLKKRLKFNVTSPQQLYIEIATTEKLLSKRTIAAINDIWGRNVPKLEFLSAHSKQELSVVNWNKIDDTRTRQENLYQMLKYTHDYYYNWFMLANDDVYIRVENVLHFLSDLDLSQMVKSQEENTKHKPHNHNCIGGPRVIFSRAFLLKLIPYFQECLRKMVLKKNTMTRDQYLEHCISRKLGARCTWIDQMSQLFMNETEVLNALNDFNNQRLQTILLLYSLKDPIMMYRIHKYYSRTPL